METVSKKNKVYRVIRHTFTDEIVEIGGLVVALENDEYPFCVKLNAFDGTMDSLHYSDDDCDCFSIYQLEPAKQGDKSMFLF